MLRVLGCNLYRNDGVRILGAGRFRKVESNRRKVRRYSRNVIARLTWTAPLHPLTLTMVSKA